MTTIIFPTGHVVTEPPAIQAAPVEAGRTISLYRFLKRFTFSEMVAILTAEKTDPIVEAVILLMRSTKDQEIDLDDPQTVGGIDTLIAKSLLQPGRKTDILS